MKTKHKKVPKVHYEVHYLAIIIIIFVLIEGGLFSIAGQADWQAGLSMLDMSGAVSTVSADLQNVFQPVADTISDLNLFYQSAATAMTQLLDVSDSDYFAPVSVVLNGVYDFYQQAADQMASILDINHTLPSTPVVAGISISTH